MYLFRYEEIHLSPYQMKILVEINSTFQFSILFFFHYQSFSIYPNTLRKFNFSVFTTVFCIPFIPSKKNLLWRPDTVMVTSLVLEQPSPLMNPFFTFETSDQTFLTVTPNNPLVLTQNKLTHPDNAGI